MRDYERHWQGSDAIARTDRSAGESSVLAILSRGSRDDGDPRQAAQDTVGVPLQIVVREHGYMSGEAGSRSPSSPGFGSASDCRRYRWTGDRTDRTDRSTGESSILSVLSIPSRASLVSTPRPPAGDPGRAQGASTLSSTPGSLHEPRDPGPRPPA